MALTPETLPRHELAGLAVRVAAAPNPDLVGIAGRVVRETAGTLCVRGADARVRQVPKQGSTFEFALTDEAADPGEGSGTTSELALETAGVRPRQSLAAADSAAHRFPDGGEGVAYVTVDGMRLLSRPALRTETTGDSQWR